jgi:hypothetical protein
MKKLKLILILYAGIAIGPIYIDLKTEINSPLLQMEVNNVIK